MIFDILHPRLCIIWYPIRVDVCVQQCIDMGFDKTIYGLSDTEKSESSDLHHRYTNNKSAVMLQKYNNWANINYFQVA